MNQTATSADERYEVLEALGQNDYLSVFRAWDRRIRRPVAIMELHPRFFTTEEHRKRVWGQVLESADASHVGLVRLYEIDQGRTWIVTELLEQNLRDRAAGKGIPEAEARYLLWAALDALAYLHQRERLHGDIRPANLLVDAAGRLKLSYPFGLRLGGEVPRRIQNQKYLAPELINTAADVPGPATDLYCLGFSVYELLVGSKFDELLGVTPAESRNAAESANWLRWVSSLDAKLPPIKSVLPNLADDTARLIDQLVEKSIDKRPASAAAARDSLSFEEPPEPLPTSIALTRSASGKSKSETSTNQPAAASPNPDGAVNVVKKPTVETSNRIIKQVPNGVVWAVVLIGAAVVGLLLRPGATVPAAKETEVAKQTPPAIVPEPKPEATTTATDTKPAETKPAEPPVEPMPQQPTAAELAEAIRQQIAGTWTWMNKDQEGSVTLELQDGVLSGNLKLPSGRETPIVDGTYAGGVVHFATNVEDRVTGQIVRSEFEATVDGDALSGTIETHRDDKATLKGDWKAQRTK